MSKVLPGPCASLDAILLCLLEKLHGFTVRLQMSLDIVQERLFCFNQHTILTRLYTSAVSWL